LILIHKSRITAQLLEQHLVFSVLAVDSRPVTLFSPVYKNPAPLLLLSFFSLFFFPPPSHTPSDHAPLHEVSGVLVLNSGSGRGRIWERRIWIAGFWMRRTGLWRIYWTVLKFHMAADPLTDGGRDGGGILGQQILSGDTSRTGLDQDKVSIPLSSYPHPRSHGCWGSRIVNEEGLWDLSAGCAGSSSQRVPEIEFRLESGVTS
jgi:hypothetical protein